MLINGPSEQLAACSSLLWELFTLILSLAPKNRNLKNFARSKLAYYIIILISCLIIVLVAGAVVPEDNRIEIGNALLKIFRSLGMNV